MCFATLEIRKRRWGWDEVEGKFIWALFKFSPKPVLNDETIPLVSLSDTKGDFVQIDPRRLPPLYYGQEKFADR